LSAVVYTDVAHEASTVATDASSDALQRRFLMCSEDCERLDTDV